jgi:hypothetical protein
VSDGETGIDEDGACTGRYADCSRSGSEVARRGESSAADEGGLRRLCRGGATCSGIRGGPSNVAASARTENAQPSARITRTRARGVAAISERRGQRLDAPLKPTDAMTGDQVRWTVYAKWQYGTGRRGLSRFSTT